MSRVLNKLRILPVCIALLVAIAACSEKSPPPPPPEVSFVIVRPQRVTLYTDFPGRTAAFRIAEVRPQVSGIIKKRLFTEGTVVKFREQLYEIDPAPYKASLDSAVAARDKAQAQAVASTLQADRFKPLAEERAVSRQDYDNAASAKGQALADVAAAKASIATARINLEYTRVLSPITGRTGRSTVTEGALVTASQASALVTIQQLDPIYVDVNQPSATLLRLKRDLASGRLKKSGENAAQVKLVLEDGSVYPHEGQLKFAEVTVDPGTGSITLRAEFPNPQGLLLPGMFVREQIEEGVAETALLVPQQGITRDQKGDPFALVLDGEGKVQRRPLKTDRALGDQWMVVDGLKDGDKVVVSGQQLLMLAPPGTQPKATETTLEQLRQLPLAGQQHGPDGGGAKPGGDAKGASPELKKTPAVNASGS